MTKQLSNSLARAFYYKGALDTLDREAMGQISHHCLRINETNDVDAYFTMREVLNEHICDEMGWA